MRDVGDSKVFLVQLVASFCVLCAHPVYGEEPVVSQGKFGSEFVFRSVFFPPYLMGASASTAVGIGMVGTGIGPPGGTALALGAYGLGFGLIVPDVLNSWHHSAWEKQAEKFAQKQGLVFDREHEESFRLLYPDGFHYSVGTDPAVIETSVQPLTISETEEKLDRIETDLFGMARQSWLRPPRVVVGAGGHISIGLDNFEGDLQLFRNFLVDYINHDEFSEGIFQKDSLNARTPRANAAFRERFSRLLKDYDRGRFDSIEDMAGAFLREVLLNKGRNFSISTKGVTEGASTSRLELRGHRAQANAVEYLELIKMHGARIEYLRRRGGLVPFEDSPISRNPRVKERRFHEYIRETGLAWSVYRRHVPLRRRASAALVGGAQRLCDWALSALNPKQ